MNWHEMYHRLMTYELGIHNLRNRLPPDKLAEQETGMGKLPSEIAEMLAHFNGVELFVDAIPFLTIFGLSTPDDPPELDWFLDRFTPKWRVQMNRPDDWVIAISNYGGVFVLDERHLVREWDSAQKKWIGDGIPLTQWIEWVFAEGESYMSD